MSIEVKLSAYEIATNNLNKLPLKQDRIFSAALAELKGQRDFQSSERERLMKKLERIENLSKHAWEQVDSNPDEAKELFRMIYAESK